MKEMQKEQSLASKEANLAKKLAETCSDDSVQAQRPLRPGQMADRIADRGGGVKKDGHDCWPGILFRPDCLPSSGFS